MPRLKEIAHSEALLDLGLRYLVAILAPLIEEGQGAPNIGRLPPKRIVPPVSLRDQPRLPGL
jgi:hypothetical protein